MGRHRCCDASDMDDENQFAMWRGQVASTIRGKRGQAFLKELIEALDSLPEKQLIKNDLIQDGEVCALGSVGIMRGIDMTKLDAGDYYALAKVFGITHQLVQEIEWINDEAGAPDQTPEQRWQSIRDWAVRHIRPSSPKTAGE